MKRENQNGDDDNQNEGNNGSGGGGGGGNNGGGRGNKRFRGNDETIRLLIPSRIAGAIIGKGGQHINRLRAQYKATINVEDCQGPERTVHVSAEFDNAISIVEEMLKNFDEKEDEYDVRMLIHQSLAGCVIGKGGSKIKEIRDKIGCRILKVFSNVCPQSSDRIVQCVGKADQAVESLREILDLVKEVPIKGPVQNYDPINYDDLFADKYGGFGDNGGRGGGGGGGGNFRDGGGRFDRRGGGDDRGFDRRDGGRRNDRRDNNGGGGGGGGGPRGMRDRDFIDPWAPNQGPMGGNNFGGGGNGNGFGNNFGGNMGGMGGGNMGGGGGNMSGNGSMGGGGGNFGNQGNMGLGNNLGNSGGMGGNNMGGGLGGGFNSGMGGPGNNMSGNMGGGNMGPNNGGGNFGGNNAGGGGGGGGGGDDKNTTQVTIPKDLAGAIIGKAGGRIRRIRMESNAFITIDEPLPGSTDRIITITGSPKQIQMAQYLLQQSVHEHRRQY